ncbi:MAG TPA: transposase [Patescibacteria group bacterium]|nr:transposase [Patescibacteria group bacterium]
MAIPKRHAALAGTYFVTSRTWQSRRLFQVADACDVFMENLLRHRSGGKYALHAFVLMPDHFHLLLTPAREVTLERAVQFVKGGSSRSLGEVRRLCSPVWQRGFDDHRIRDLADYDTHLGYIHRNPVKTGLVSEAKQFHWSSASGGWTVDGVPQRLKPHDTGVENGTAEAVP